MTGKITSAQEAVEKIFVNLTRWRNLPKYQLERRADIFFSLYLKDILEAKLSEDGNPVELSELVIPEFPIQQGNQHHTANVDYVMFSKDLATVYLIEFKTDMGSLRPDQFAYLNAAKEKIVDKATGFKEILNELWSVFAATDDKQKYFHLFKLLEKYKLLEPLPDELESKLYSGRRQGISAIIDRMEIVPTQINAAVIVFIQPKDFSQDEIEKFEKFKLSEMTRITFENVIEYLNNISSPFSKLFATYIHEWTTAAGAESPEEVAAKLNLLISKTPYTNQ